ncbi:MAG: isocitrate/isopropylmalate dehydrogenase family protein [Methanomassiliicoccales archaeon]|nr:isocitrate/isopropylmalate dehydrogenase family protein [Methanomassiliicoccales archaeon]NYT16127.1 isocitrate/isopropylmalate dehydrogenase family protein [Methanomassiliicoccales archaeon]
MKKIAVIEGDGIGPEVIRSTVRVLEATGARIELFEAEMGLDCNRKNGSYLPKETVESLSEADACLFGAITSSNDPEYRSPLLQLRKEFELFANVRPLKRISPDLGMVDLDTIIFRENTEGMYTGDEVDEGDSIILRRRVSEGAVRRLIRFSNEYALLEGRRSMTCVHKANVIRRSDGLFRDIFLQEMRSSPLEAREMLVDACAAAMISHPEKLDCIVTLNLYGDILSDEGAALVGGLGLAPSANIGEDLAIFEPVHGSAPDIAGKGIANPVASILSAVMMLRYLGMHKEAELMECSLSNAVRAGRRTPDIGGNLTTDEFTDEIIRRMTH